MRDAVGPDVDILVEVHGNLGTTSAIAFGQRIEELRPFFYEEPVDAMNVDAMLKVSQNVHIPIAAGERLYTRYGFREYIEKQALDVLQPDMGLAGGLTEVKRSQPTPRPMICTCSHTTARGQSHRHGCAAGYLHHQFHHPGVVPTATGALRSRRSGADTQAVDGYYSPTRAPGLGVVLNRTEADRYTRIRIS